MLIGYVRVSTGDQTLDLQRDALDKAGCERIFTDVLSGSWSSRPGLNELLAFIRAVDTVVVWRLDWFGRSLKHLIETVDALPAREVGFRSMTESIDTTTGRQLVFHFCRGAGRVRARSGPGTDQRRSYRGPGPGTFRSTPEGGPGPQEDRAGQAPLR